jgi:hypothetical protein
LEQPEKVPETPSTKALPVLVATMLATPGAFTILTGILTTLLDVGLSGLMIATETPAKLATRSLELFGVRAKPLICRRPEIEGGTIGVKN